MKKYEILYLQVRWDPYILYRLEYPFHLLDPLDPLDPFDLLDQ